jgi:hypothetical protein
MHDVRVRQPVCRELVHPLPGRSEGAGGAVVACDTRRGGYVPETPAACPGGEAPHNTDSAPSEHA